MELWIATGNQHKLTEFKMLFQLPNLTLKSQKNLTTYFSPNETGKTFLENAKIKAKALSSVMPEHWVLAEDSGLCVIGLNNSPGIYSARYAGESATDIENNLKVLQMLKIRSPSMREAELVSHVVISDPSGAEHDFEGRLKGKIAEKPRGDQGFGYDYIFLPDGQTKTLGELGPTFKNQVSHRSRACKKAAEFIKSVLNNN